MSFKELFSRSLGADPTRLHFASHSHHLWPDASYDGQMHAWNDAARLADRKWEKVMGEVWPAAQAEVAAELATGNANDIVFAPNTHQLLISLVTAAPRRAGQLKVLTSDGEFHSARRQMARWEEEGWVAATRVSTEPFETFSDRFISEAQTGGYDFIFVSQVMFGNGRICDRQTAKRQHQRNGCAKTLNHAICDPSLYR